MPTNEKSKEKEDKTRGKDFLENEGNKTFIFYMNNYNHLSLKIIII